MDAQKQFKKWLSEICRGEGSESTFIKHDKGEAVSSIWLSKFIIRERVKVYTRDHYYTIVAIIKENGHTYLGCTVSNRKPRAGETWTRGNDLPDGPFSQKTWDNIKNAIIAYELVKIAPKVREHGVPENGVPEIGPAK